MNETRLDDIAIEAERLIRNGIANKNAAPSLDYLKGFVRRGTLEDAENWLIWLRGSNK